MRMLHIVQGDEHLNKFNTYPRTDGDHFTITTSLAGVKYESAESTGRAIVFG